MEKKYDKFTILHLIIFSFNALFYIFYVYDMNLVMA